MEWMLSGRFPDKRLLPSRRGMRRAIGSIGLHQWLRQTTADQYEVHMAAMGLNLSRTNCGRVLHR